MCFSTKKPPIPINRPRNTKMWIHLSIFELDISFFGNALQAKRKEKRASNFLMRLDSILKPSVSDFFLLQFTLIAVYKFGLASARSFVSVWLTTCFNIEWYFGKVLFSSQDAYNLYFLTCYWARKSESGNEKEAKRLFDGYKGITFDSQLSSHSLCAWNKKSNTKVQLVSE